MAFALSSHILYYYYLFYSFYICMQHFRDGITSIGCYIKLIIIINHYYVYKLEIITECVVNALTHKVKIVPSVLLGNKFMCLDINATLFA